MKLAILGGTFNPIHNGHIRVVKLALEKYDNVMLIPNARPPHKEHDNSTAMKHKLAMLMLATKDMDNVTVDAYEVEKGGISYTIDTINYIYSEFVFFDKPGLIIGDDLVDGLPTWRNIDELASKVDFVISNRMSDKRTECPYPHTYIDGTTDTISSTEIRNKVKLGKDVSDLVPWEVNWYIQTNKLYANLAQPARAVVS